MAFGLPNLRIIRPAVVAADVQLKIASLFDLAGTKALVVQQRGEAKDYIDIDALITAGVTLPEILVAEQLVFGAAFNPQITLKALSYLGDGDLPSLPEQLKARLVAAVAATDLGNLPTIESLRGE